MRVVAFQPDHVLRLALQPMQREHEPPMTIENADVLSKVGASYAALAVDGRTLAAAGIIPQWPGRAIAWALVAHDAGPHFVRITREVRRFLDACEFARVEAAVDAFFPQAIRWAEVLGFVRETPEPMRGYGIEGRPAYLYARVRA